MVATGSTDLDVERGQTPVFFTVGEITDNTSVDDDNNCRPQTFKIVERGTETVYNENFLDIENNNDGTWMVELGTDEVDLDNDVSKDLTLVLGLDGFPAQQTLDFSILLRKSPCVITDLDITQFVEQTYTVPKEDGTLPFDIDLGEPIQTPVCDETLTVEVSVQDA